MKLSPDAQAVAKALHEIVDGRSSEHTVALLVPYQDQRTRAFLIDTFDRVVHEFRAAGWTVETSVTRKPDGEAYSITPSAPPPRPHTPDEGGTT